MHSSWQAPQGPERGGGARTPMGYWGGWASTKWAVGLHHTSVYQHTTIYPSCALAGAATCDAALVSEQFIVVVRRVRLVGGAGRIHSDQS